jgi:hypothetical protein
MGVEGSRQRARSEVSVTLRPTPRTNLLKETGGRWPGGAVEDASDLAELLVDPGEG